MNFRNIAFFCWAIILNCNSLFAQDAGPAMLAWRSFLPYNQVVDFAFNDQTFYCATSSGMFTYNKEDGSLDAYSKVKGMHDIGMTHIAYDTKTKLVILTYENSNIDLFKNQGFTNIPDLKLTQINGDKSIHDLVAENGVAYLSTGIGLVLLNLEKQEIKETVRFYEDSVTAPVYAAQVIGNTIYAATNIGLFSSPISNSFLTNSLTWEKISNTSFHYLVQSNGTLFAAAEDSIFQLKNGDIAFFTKTNMPIVHLDEAETGIWVSSFAEPKGSGYLFNINGELVDSVPCKTPSKIMSLDDGSIWYGDQSNIAFPKEFGLRKKKSATESEAYFPAGPITSSSFDISVNNGELWVAHGGWDAFHGTANRAMFSKYKDGAWKNFAWISENDWYQDFIRILKDPYSGKVYAGSFGGGLVVVNPDDNFTTYGTVSLPEWSGNPGLYNVAGLSLDSKGNLWIANFGGNNELTVMNPQGQFFQGKSVLNNIGSFSHSASDVVVDDYDLKWFIAPINGGVIAYNDKGTIENPADDQYRIFKTGKDNGNLPSNNTTCIVKDKDGAIWVGTDNGIAIYQYPPDMIFSSTPCDANLKIVNLDGINDYLFARQAVTAMAVDGANRKWVGTANGVWLLSEDAEKIIYRFTSENSPLPSNDIIAIDIDPVNGDVYFSTGKGIVSFRSTATESNPDEQSNLLIYPNPVPPGFEGMIAVRNVPENADVRFTDIAGQLVYRTKALGGQAVWDGKDYLGRKAQSGVYLIFIVNKEGTKKETSKLIIQR